MNIALILSLILLISLVCVRGYEIKQAKQTPVTRILQMGDEYVTETYIWIKKSLRSLNAFLVYIKHSFIERAWYSLTHSVIFAKKKVDILHDRLNGKRDIKKTDHVSFYLQSVTDHKNSVRKSRPGRD